MLKKFKDHNLTREVYFYYVRTFLYFIYGIQSILKDTEILDFHVYTFVHLQA